MTSAVPFCILTGAGDMLATGKASEGLHGRLALTGQQGSSFATVIIILELVLLDTHQHDKKLPLQL